MKLVHTLTAVVALLVLPKLGPVAASAPPPDNLTSDGCAPNAATISRPSRWL